MFWNDPNLYSVAFKDLPNYRYFHNYPTFFPQTTPQYFTPPVTPQMFTPPVTPQYFTPQWPVTPFMQTPPVTPFFNPMTTGYNYFNYSYPYYRPFGL